MAYMFKDVLLELFQKGIVNNLQIITGFGVGLIFAGIYQRFVGIRKIEKTYERLIIEKDKYNADIRAIVIERLDKVKVEKVDKDLIRKIKKYFKHIIKTN